MPCAADPIPTDLDMTRWQLRMFLAEINSIPTGHTEYQVIVADDKTKPLYPDGATEDEVNELTKRLCEYLKFSNEAHIQSLSLELQIWWRDHQAADELRQATNTIAT